MSSTVYSFCCFDLFICPFPLPNLFVILGAQKEMAQSDILVCGKCHSVFHFIDLFKEHKTNNCKRLSAFNDCVSLFSILFVRFCFTFHLFQRETRPKIWAYLLWKQTQFQQRQEDEEDNPWKLYQTWMQLEDSTRQSWLVAGGTIQSFERVSRCTSDIFVFTNSFVFHL